MATFFLAAPTSHASIIVGYLPDINVASGMAASAIDDTGSSAGVTVGALGPFGGVVNVAVSAAGSSFADAVANNDYFQFSLTALSVNTFDLDTLTFGAYNGGASVPRGWVLRSSSDGFVNDIANSLVTAAFGSPPEPFSVDLSSFAGLTDITLRLYTFAPIQNFVVNFQDIVVNGTVFDGSGNVINAPEPASIALFAVGLAGFGFAKRHGS